MIHDVALSSEHLIFVIPPVKFDLQTLMSGKATPADALRYAEREPTRILIIRKDCTGKPVQIEQPAAMAFHHGNAFEKDGTLFFDTILTPDDSILRSLHSFANNKIPDAAPNKIVRFAVDLAAGKIKSRTEIGTDCEFPRYDPRAAGKETRHLYTASFENREFLESGAITRHDLRGGASKIVQAGKGRIFGEPVFVPKKTGDGWILAQGYDAARDETFLEIRDAATMDFAARVWTQNYIPLGFHGNFYAD
jgi:carotenoid cleavage dioxygenase-like enzyme